MTLRLLWALQNVEGLKTAATNGKAVFGGVDCWLLYKFTGTLQNLKIIKHLRWYQLILFWNYIIIII